MNNPFGEESLYSELYSNSSDLLSTASDDAKLSDETFVFLKQKLSDAHSTIAILEQREQNLTTHVEQIRRDNQDGSKKFAALRLELQNMQAKHLSREQKIDSERRQRLCLQEKLATVEKELTDTKHRSSILEKKLMEANKKLITSENVTNEVYKLANDGCKQRDMMKEQVEELEEMLSACKTSLSSMHKEKSMLSEEVSLMKSEYKTLDTTFQDSLNELQLMKEESKKQEDYINDTLNKFKEVTIHFNSMKNHFLQQQKRLEEVHHDTIHQCSVENRMKNEAEEKLKEFGDVNQKATMREFELKSEVEKLEVTLNSMTAIRHDVEEKNKQLEDLVEQFRSEKINLETENNGLKTELSFELQHMGKLKNQLEKEQVKKENLKERLFEVNEKLKALELKHDGMESTKNKLKHANGTLKKEQKKLEDACLKLTNTIEELSEENAQLKNELNCREQEIHAFVEDGKNIDTCLKERYDAYATLQRNHTESMTSLKGLESERDKLNCDVEMLRRSKVENEKHTQELQEKLTKCQFLFMENDEKLSTVMEKVNALTAQNTNYEIIIHQLKEQAKDTKQTCQHHKQSEDELRNELLDTSHRLESTISENEQVRTKLTDALKRITQTMEEEEAKLREDCKKKEGQISKLLLKLKEYEEINAANKTDLVNSSERANLLNVKTEALLQENSRLKENQEKFEQTMDTLRKTEAELKKDIETKTSMISKLEVRLNEHEKSMVLNLENVASYNKLWEDERMQAIKELQEELDRDYTNQRNYKALSLWDEC